MEPRVHVQHLWRANYGSAVAHRGPGSASVPYGLGKTVEHFPDLHKFSLERDGDRFVLVNETAAGTVERRDLAFHGGSGPTLEMRIFG